MTVGMPPEHCFQSPCDPRAAGRRRLHSVSFLQCRLVADTPCSLRSGSLRRSTCQTTPCSASSASSTRSSPACCWSRARWACQPLHKHAQHACGRHSIRSGAQALHSFYAALQQLTVFWGARAGEEPLAQCGRAQRRAAAVLRHQGGELLHCAVWGVPGHRRAIAGDSSTPPGYAE